METIHAEFDIGNLLLSNVVNVKSSEAGIQSEENLKFIARESTQILIDKIWELPYERHDHVTVAELPEPITKIPREKPIPKAKPLTRWQEYSKKKGIQQKKRDTLIWDDTSKEWKPRWGYHRANSDKTDWLVEVPDNADPNADYFGIKKDKKKQMIAKNEYQRLRNIADSKNVKVTNLETSEKASKEQVSKALSYAKTSTASMGKFVDQLKKEKAPRNTGKKRKFTSNIPNDMKTEKDNNLKILDDLQKKKPKLDVKEAVDTYIQKSSKTSIKDQSEKRGKVKPKNNRKKAKRVNAFPGNRKNFKRSNSFAAKGSRKKMLKRK